MTYGEASKIIETEIECVQRDCDRKCEKCDLVMKTDEIVEAYKIAIQAIRLRVATTGSDDIQIRVLSHE